MYRIVDPNAAATLPAVPTAAAGSVTGYFQEQNSGAGIAATDIRGWWLNMIQEELAAIVLASGATLNQAANNQVLGAIYGRLVAARLFGVVGSFTYTPSSSLVTRVLVQVIGGAGAGGGAPATGASQYSVGGGGGAGGFSQKLFFTAQGFNGAAMVIGAGGTGVSGAAGNNGADSSFTPTAAAAIVAKGGQGASSAGPSGANFGTSNGGGGPINGSGSPDVWWGGSAGNPGLSVGTFILGGLGGCGPLGGGSGFGSSGSMGGAGLSYGAGGGGSSNGPSASAQPGGQGAGGAIIVYEYT